MGIRSIDIVNLTLDDINWDREIIHFIQKKTGVEVTLPMPVDVGNILYKYLTLERPKTDSRRIFVRQSAPYGPVGRSACARALKAALPNRNVEGSGFHVLRKTFATTLLSKGLNVYRITDALGQKSIASVHRYLSLDDKNMSKCSLSLSEFNINMKIGFLQ